MGSVHALRTWISSTPGLIIIGRDANTPEIDHPDPRLSDTLWIGPRLEVHSANYDYDGAVAAGSDQLFVADQPANDPS